MNHKNVVLFGNDEMVMWNPNSRKYNRVFATYEIEAENIFTHNTETFTMAITEVGHRAVIAQPVITRQQACNDLDKLGLEYENFF